MELERKGIDKGKLINPTCIKDMNMQLGNLFDTSLRLKRQLKDGFKDITKLKRNFK